MTHRISRALFGATLVTLALALAPVGCAVSGTGGDLVEFELAFAGGSLDGAPLGEGTTLYDPAWTVELTEARIVVGAVYLFPPDAIARVVLPFLSQAHAHAGDDNVFAVNALTEYRDQVVVDALDPTPQSVGSVFGEAGAADIATVWIDAPRAALAEESSPTHGHHGWIAGTARRGEQEVRFEAGLTLEDTPLSQRVDRIPVDGDAALDAGSRVLVETFAGQWLQQVDFERLLEDGALEADADGVTRPDASHPLQRAWLIEFHDPSAFAVRTEGGSNRD